MIQEGLIITLIGMTVVFIFLSVMVVAIKITSWLVLKFSKKRDEALESEPQYGSKGVESQGGVVSEIPIDTHLELVAASVAAAKFLSEQEIE